MAKNEPIRTGVAGLGRAGWGMHCGAIESKPRKFRLLAACDPIEQRRTMAQEKFGCSTYATIEEMASDPAVELLTVATRSIDHFAHAMVGLKAGKDVYLEKPMCLTYAQATKLRTAAAKSAGNLYVGHNRRFDGDFLHVREIIASGVLGEVYEIKLSRLGYDRRDDWQTLKEYGGGQLLNWGAHIIDHALQLLEAPVKNIWSDLKLIAALGDAEDHLKIVLTGANGRLVDIEISGGAAIRAPEYVVLGDRGSLVLQGSDITLKYLDPRRKLKKGKANAGTPGMTFGSNEPLKWIEKAVQVKPRKPVSIWDELHKAIRKGGRFPIAIDEAVEVMRVISTAKKGTKF